MVTEHSIRLADSLSSTHDKTGRPTSLLPRQIPWGYGHDRVTAIAVDPDQLFAYWEVRDESLDAARRQLGPAGSDAALVLRVFDTSGRIFDGTNAHSWFDQEVHRNDRQWFCHVGKPASSAHVEMGLRTRDGRFVKLVRSGRVDFPRDSPAPPRDMEWMRVVPHTGQIESRATAFSGPPPAPPGPPPGANGAGSHDGHVVSREGYDVVETAPWLERSWSGSWEWYEREVSHFETDSGWQLDPNDPNVSYRMITMRWEEFGMSSSRWESGPLETSWQAGPFTYPTEVIAPSVERYEGPRVVYRTGEQVRVLHGPWQVIIRGLNPHLERRVLARWEVHRSWGGIAGLPGDVSPDAAGVAGRRLAPGASERLMLSASELRLQGASEVFYLGASERRLGGASESRFVGASQWLQRGASERRLVGMSERRLGGASERRLMGMSERRLGGASEQRMFGMSERRLGGASERRGASEWRGASEGRLSAASAFPAIAEPRKG